MIKMSYVEDHGHLSLCVSGHAGAGESGNDIVCAGVSAIVSMLALYIDRNRERFSELPQVELTHGFGGVQCSPMPEYYETVREVYRVAVDGLTLIAETFAEYFSLAQSRL